MWQIFKNEIKDTILEKLTGVNIMLLNGDQMFSEEALDVGMYYYLLKGKKIYQVKKTDVAQITWNTKETTSDNSKYVKPDFGSCVQGEC